MSIHGLHYEILSLPPVGREASERRAAVAVTKKTKTTKELRSSRLAGSSPVVVAFLGGNYTWECHQPHSAFHRRPLSSFLWEKRHSKRTVPINMDSVSKLIDRLARKSVQVRCSKKQPLRDRNALSHSTRGPAST
ncbi:unnamed protein product [Caenorhabditis auriculariae]|uniref:Uncharacterized protein n=1 Tax=Caenorhabditis auriculariae TaxID=2777116 RepID=A0A8S1H636_9PELO|nr:unnamed protein product [Caenorhabditis auriculariae]